MKRNKLVNKAVNAAAGKMGIDGKMPDQIDLNFTKRLKASGFLGVILAFCVFVFTASVYLYNNIPKTAASIGTALGNITGVSTGSFQASLDAPDAVKAPGMEGHSKEEIKTVMDAFLKNSESLEIMRTDMKFVNLSNTEDTYYSLVQRSAEAVFFVDFKEAEYEADSNTLKLPEIRIDLQMKEASETLAEYTKTEETKEGVTGTLTSDASSAEEAVRQLKEDTSFMRELESHAEAQLTELFKAMLDEETEIHVSWKSGE